MPRLNILLAACTLLCLLLGLVAANPVVETRDAPGPYKKYVPKDNILDCPAAGGSKYTGPRGGKWGILCGWDTVSVTVSINPPGPRWTYGRGLELADEGDVTAPMGTL